VPSPPPHDRVAAAVLLADPEYNPADPRTAGGTFEPRYAAPRRHPAFPAPLNGRVRSYCRRHDIVCQRDDLATSKDTAVNCELRGQETLAFRCGRSPDAYHRCSDLRLFVLWHGLGEQRRRLRP
jgi:hypothetical protein